MNKKPSWLRERWREETTKRPFLLLMQHFAQRTVGGSDTSSEVDLGAGGALAVLAVPGAFTALALMGKYSSLIQWLSGLHLDPYRIAISDEYFFIVYSMAITGLVTLLRWDHLLPGRRDYVNLAPLPLQLRSIFLANVVALASMALIFAIDVNAVASFVFPMLVTYQAPTMGPFLKFAAAHILATMGISLFTFVALLALQGLLMAILPDALYRRVSLAVRTILLIFFFGLLISAFLLPLDVLNFRFGSRLAGTWWPPSWFLALFESRLAQLHSLAHMPGSVAIAALIAALALAVAAFALSYRRYFLRIPERSEGPSKRSRVSWLRFEWLNPLLRVWVRPGPETASFKFMLKTLMRNETHLLLFGIWVGIGALLSLETIAGTRAPSVSQDLQGGALVAAPLILAYAVIAGLRFVFDIPAMVEANWIFRLSDPSVESDAVARKLMAVCVLPWLLGVWLPIAGSKLGWQDASLVGAAHCLFLLVGIDVALLRFRKIPFTCSFTAGRDRMLKLLVVSFLTLAVAIPMLVIIENAILKHPWKLSILAVFIAAADWLIRTKAEKREVQYEDKGAPTFALLHLSGSD
jgi:hypothetical protein